MAGEFDLIKQYFSRTSGEQLQAKQEAGVLLGVADDCAIFQQTPGSQIATSIDLLIEGRHFFADVDPYALGHKALAVNLSDLAAMGAKPIGCLLGLALPRVDEAWLSAFSSGFYALSDTYACPLIGGDTTRSEQGICISVTVFGEVRAPFLQRNKAQVGDDIWVSGRLGAAHTALMLLNKHVEGEALSNAEVELLALTRDALERPTPRIALGQALYQVAHATLDISDGLVQDLSHILKQSHVAAVIEEDLLPVADALLTRSPELRRDAILGGGDVYELCFTAPPAHGSRIRAISAELNLPLTRIGVITDQDSQSSLLQVHDRFAKPVEYFYAGFDHFS